MAARTNPALSTFLDSMFLDSMVGAGTAIGDGEPTCVEAVDSLSSHEGVVCASELGGGQAPTQEHHDAESKEDSSCGIEEKAQIPGVPGSAAYLPHHATAWPAHTSAIGTVIQAYNTRTVQLERQCLDLMQENKQLRRGLEADQLQQERLSELNLRLSCEVRRVRRELATASAQAKRLDTDLRIAKQKRATAAAKLRLVRRKSASLGSMLHRSEDKLVEDERSTTEQQVNAVEPATIEAPPGLSGLTGPSMFTSSVQPCRCGDFHGNICTSGCFQHSTYSRALMLAHHTLHQDISQGPPGLEQARENHQNDDVAFRLVTRRRAGARRRQPPL